MDSPPRVESATALDHNADYNSPPTHPERDGPIEQSASAMPPREEEQDRIDVQKITSPRTASIKSCNGENEDTTSAAAEQHVRDRNVEGEKISETPQSDHQRRTTPRRTKFEAASKHGFEKTLRVIKTYLRFVGPGFMISVAYIDPGNYATDVAAGASYRFKLLFMVFLSNVIAIYLQSLCIHLGCVTDKNLAEMIRDHTPFWLNIVLYIFGQAAIIATDMAEVIGTAIALSLLSNGKIPVVAGCAIAIVDVLFILVFYNQNRASMSARRAFELFIAMLVIGVLICFCIELSLLQNTTPAEVFRGYLPSSALVQSNGLYQSCGILGATVMPHSLYLGSGLVQDRVREMDLHERTESATSARQKRQSMDSDAPFRPSIKAIRKCRAYAIVELSVSLFFFALLVNSSILIVSGASLYNVQGADSASLFQIYRLLQTSLAPAAATSFAVALLLSGLSAGIICTMAGQMISQGQINLTMKPWKQRLFTRSIAIMPSIVVAGALGESGLSKALVGSQVALSVILPFVSAPLIWFTMRSKYMSVTIPTVPSVQQIVGQKEASRAAETTVETDVAKKNMRVPPLVAFFAVIFWAIIVIMNVALLVLVGLGKG